MSSYINFFIRKDINEEPYFIPLGSFSRSSAVYQAVTSCPFERIRAMKFEELNSTVNDLCDSRRKYEECIKNAQNKIVTIIPSFNNSVQEKMEGIDEQERYIDDINEEISDIQFAIGYFSCLQEIVFDNENYSSSKDTIIYCGIDISDPTKENMI